MAARRKKMLATRIDSSDTGRGPWLEGGQPRAGRIARAYLRSTADVREVEKYRHEDLLPGRTIYECLKAAAQLDPDKAAMIYLRSANAADAPHVTTYARLIASIERAANLFHAAAAESRSVVGVVLPMLPEGLIATWAAATAGICVPINPHLEKKFIISILNSARATVLVTSRGGIGTASPGSIADIVGRVPTLKRILFVDPDSRPGEGIVQDDDFMVAIDAYPAGRLIFEPAVERHAEAMYMPTGGTTAAPKLVVMTHWGQLSTAWNVGALMGSSIDGVVGHGMPNFHCGGAISLGLRAMIYGQTLLTLTMDGFRDRQLIREFWNIARRYRMTSLLSTPTTAAALLAVQEADCAGHCITDFHCGGSTVPLELVRKFHARFGIWLRENWGMTEVHGTTTGHLDDGKQPVIGSVGHALPHCRVKAIQVDEHNGFVAECQPGQRGVLVLSVPALMKGYWDSELDAQFFVKGMPDGGIWGNTGDLGTVDEHGLVWVFGRVKDLIVRGGHNIDPAPIEEALAEHPAVMLAAAIGRPDRDKGELPVAYVQLKTGARTTPEELMDFCRARLQERASVPVDVVILDTMPLTPVAKVSKPTLRLDAMKRTVSQIAACIVGTGGQFEVVVDESGTRPTVVLRILASAQAGAGIDTRLGQELAGFEFDTRIVPLRDSPE